MQLQISEDGYVTLSQHEPEDGGRIIVLCNESARDIVAPIVKKCGGNWRSRFDSWTVHSTKSLALFEALHELHRLHNSNKK